MTIKQEITPLNELFNVKLAELYDVEKKSNKLYQKMIKTAYTAELKSAISPESVENITHLPRLRLIMELQKVKPGKLKEVKKDLFPDLVVSSAVFNQKKDIKHDADIIFNALIIQNYKIAVYDFLHSLSLELKPEQPSLLLEQSIKDHKNTYAWLSQILRNIIIPQAGQS